MHMTLYEAEHWKEIHSSEEKETRMDGEKNDTNGGSGICHCIMGVSPLNC